MATAIQTISKPTRARALDTSGNNNHGQIYSGRALEFDGVTDYFQHNGGTVLSGVNQFADNVDWTVAFWINFTTDSGLTHIVGNDGSTSPHLILHANDNLSFRADDSDYYDFSSNKINYNTWYRLVLLASSNTLKLYLNGVQYGSTITTSTSRTSGSSGSGTFPGTQMEFTGWGMPYGTPRNYGLDGHMSDAQVWDTAWTAADVTYDYLNPEQLALNRSGTSLTNSNLKIWYPMNDGHRGQQSYILDAANTGLGDSILSNGDFSNGTTGWTFSDCSGTVGTYFGESNVCKIEVTSEDTVGMYQSNFTTIGQSYKYSFDYYIPSTNTNLDAIQLRASSSSSNKIIDSQTVADTWTSVYAYYTPVSSSVDDVWVYLNSTSTGGNDLTVGNSVYVKNIKIEPVNGKNHATTVFYGDELITSDYADNGTFTNDNGNWAVHDPESTSGVAIATWDATFGNGGDNGGLKVTISDSSAEIQGVKLAKDYFETLVVGRTYRVSIDIDGVHPSSINDFVIGLGGVTSAAFDITTSWDTYTKDLTVTSDADLLVYSTDNGTGNWFIDNVSIKEVGTASGWTDADQQLDIPQTALQSYNQLAWFSGINDSHLTHVQLSGDITKNVHNSNVSYSAWVKRNVTNAQHIIFGDDGTSVQKLIRLEVAGTISIESNNNDNTVIATLIANDTDWHHYVVTCASGTTKFYQDGHLLTNTNANVMDDALTIRRLGGGTGKGLEGSMTEASIWDAALTQAEVNELYNDGKALDALTHSNSNLFGYWRNNGLATWEDLKGSIDGTPTNFAETMLITAGADGSRDSQGFLMNRQRITNSLNLDYKDLPDGQYGEVKGFNFHATTLSIAFWIKTPTVTSNTTIIDKYEDSGNLRALRVYITSSQEIQLQLSSTGSNNEAQKTTDANLANDTWYHIALTYSSGTFAAYKDGAALSVDGNFSTVTSVEQNIAPLYIGRAQDGAKLPFEGEIDDVCIYKDVLSAAEVLRNYNAGKRSHK